MTVGDGTPTLPRGTGGAAMRLNGGVGGRYDLDARLDFLLNHWEDDFHGDAILGEYPAAKTNGTSAAVTFTAGNAQNFLDFITGTDNDGYAGQAMTDPAYTGDVGLLTEFLFQTPSSLANYKLEFGVTDATDDAGAVNSKTTPTVTASNCAVLVYDTAHSDSLDLIHVKAAGTATRVTNTGLTLAVSTLYYATFRVDGDNVRAEIRGLSGTPNVNMSYANVVGGAGIEGGNKLTPWFFTQARAGTATKTTRLYKWGRLTPAY